MLVSSRRRNPVIADVIQRLNYMERRGSGFKKIIKSIIIMFRILWSWIEEIFRNHNSYK